MTRWQRRARLFLGVFVIVFAFVVYFAIGRREPSPKAPPAPRADPNAVLEGTRGRLDQAKGARQDYRVFYDKLLTYADGRSKLAGVRAEIDQRAGRNFVLRADSAEVGAELAHYLLEGHVQVVTSDGLTVEAGEATYSEAEGIVRAPGPVRFVKGTLSGTSVGMTYDKERDVLWLLDQAVIKVAPEGQEPGADITAGAAGWARSEKYIRFERGVTMVRQGQRLEGDSGTGYLTEDETRVQQIEIRGGSRISGAPGEAAGSLEAMQARDINLDYSQSGEGLERAALAGAATIDLRGAARSAPRRLAADRIDLGFAPDGTTITAISAHDRVQLDLPAEADAPARTIRAASMQGSGPAGGAITKVGFRGNSGDVEFRERPRGAASPRVAHARQMDLTVQPGFGTVEDARFSGGARFEDGDVTGTAREAQYAVSGGSVRLSGEEEGRRPQVVKGRATIEGTEIQVTLEGRKIAAQGRVQSVFLPEAANSQPPTADSQQPSPATTAGKGDNRPASGQGVKPAPLPAPQGAAEAARMPGLLAQDQVTNATAETLDYDGAGGRAVYKGSPARLWQRDTSIYGNELVLEEGKGNLHASGAVVTTMLLDYVDEESGKTEKVQSVAKADDLLYEDETRRAVYTKGAQMTGPQGNLSADRIELFLARSENRLERIEAYTAVTVRPEGRVATGDRLSYYAGDERYVMVGTPVTIIEEDRETTGKTLTFFRSADRIVVDGNEERRTQTKGGAKREPQPRFD